MQSNSQWAEVVLRLCFEARLKKLEDLRGPGMQRNASVARRFVELCGPWRAAAEAKEAKEADSGGSWEPVLAPFMDNSGTATARNLMSLGLSWPVESYQVSCVCSHAATFRTFVHIC